MVRWYTTIVVTAGTLANLLIAAMFLLRVLKPARSRRWGLAGTAMAIPLLAASGVAARAHLDAWMVVLPLIYVAFAVVEVVADSLLDVDVRSSRWLGPYLGLFYLGQWSLVGAAFLASTAGGFVVLASYFVCLWATFWSYRRVGHGQSAQRPS